MRNIFRQSILLALIILKLTPSIGQSCPALPNDRIFASLVINDNGIIYDTDTIVKICINSEVTIYSNNAITNTQYWTNYKSNTIPTYGGVSLPSKKYRFNQEGRFLLIQQGDLNGSKAYSCKVIEVLNAPLPIVNVTSCTAKSITLQIPEHLDNLYDKYEILWGDGQSSTLNKNNLTINHLYNSARNYDVFLTGIRTNIECSSTNVFTVEPNGYAPYITPPSVHKLQLDDKGISVNLTSTNLGLAETYILQKEVGFSYQKLSQKVLNGNSKINTINHLDSTKQFCFKLQTMDVCNNYVESGEVCTVNLNVKVEDSKNKLSWSAYPNPIDTYNIYKNGSFINLNSNYFQNNYTDLNTLCGQNYCYQVSAVTGAVESVSQNKCVIGKNIKTLSPITDGLVSIENNMISLTWNHPISTYSEKVEITKANSLNGVYASIGNSNSGKYNDLFEANSTNQVCYKLGYSDNCGNTSDQSAAFCPVILTTTGQNINWTQYEKFRNPTYTLEAYDSSNNLIKSVPVSNKFSDKPNEDDFSQQNLKFRIKITDTNGKISYSNFCSFNFSLKLLVPNAFTPNGDGINDTFKVFTTYVNKYSLHIFDRWGNILFTSNDLNDEWNGLINNNHSPIANEYIYMIEVETDSGTFLQKKGVVRVIL